jgi:hypothetical protein
MSNPCDRISSLRKEIHYFPVLVHICSVMLKGIISEDTKLDEAIN